MHAALVGNCRIEKNASDAIAVPIQTSDGPLYSCTADNNINCYYEVHVVANHEGGLSSVLPVSVAVEGNSTKPLLFVLMNSKPVHWVIDIPDDVIVQSVISVIIVSSLPRLPPPPPPQLYTDK